MGVTRLDRTIGATLGVMGIGMGGGLAFLAYNTMGWAAAGLIGLGVAGSAGGVYLMWEAIHGRA